MKWYKFCFYLLVVVILFFIVSSVALIMTSPDQEETTVYETTVPETAISTSSFQEGVEAANQVVVNQAQEKQKEYFLVSEDGFLLVFARDRETICLYTHVPIYDFPLEEQERLRTGIWFSDMMEIFHYLESYTS